MHQRVCLKQNELCCQSPPNILKCSGYCGGYNSSAALRCLSDFAELSQQTHPAVKCFNQIKHLLLTCICRAGQHFARSACTSPPRLAKKKKKKIPFTIQCTRPPPRSSLYSRYQPAHCLFGFFFCFISFFPFFAVRRILFDHSVDGCARQIGVLDLETAAKTGLKSSVKEYQKYKILSL